MSGDRDAALPEQRIQSWLSPLARFLHVEAAGGVVLLGAAATALVLANSPWSDAYAAFWKTPLGLSFGELEMRHSLKHWVSDGLMTVFFFVVGLEVKRELVLGQLREPRQAVLPLFAAAGGMAVPAALYLLLAGGGDAARGWGIPMATDIAFVVGCLALLGSRVPPDLRVLLLSLAIVDDIGAIVVIAIGYTESIAWGALAWGVSGILLVAGMQRVGVRSVGLYVVAGAGIWIAFHESGIHATIAGVILGLLTPTERWVAPGTLGTIVEQTRRTWLGGAGESGRRAALARLSQAAREASSPLERIEAALHPWSAFAVMPIFALANAGVGIGSGGLGEAGLAVAVGLVAGKPVGVLVFCLLAVRLGWTALPAGIGFGVLAAGGCLAGIGFTMSLFIAGLALEDPALESAKLGVLLASLVSGAVGMLWLHLLLPRRTA